VVFIFLSNQLYDYPLKTNKWHVATRMAALGHDVLFVDPPIRFRKFVKQVFQGRWPLRRILTFTYQPQENLTVYTPVGLPIACPFGHLVCKKLGALNQHFHLWRIKNLLSNFRNFPISSIQYPIFGIQYPVSSIQYSVLWVYHVEMEGLEGFIEKIPHDLLIYDCVDNYPAFPRYRDKPELKNWIIEREKWLAKKADLVFTTAPGLQEKLSKFNKNTFYVGNAGDFERFLVQPAVGGKPFGLATKPEGLIKIGFSGAIDSYKVNLPLLVKIAKSYPDYSLVLIGPTGVADDEPNLKELESLPNVQLLGEKPYEEMPQYFSQFDVYIIPYNLNEYTVGGCFPVKFFDALASGLPTVVTNLPCYRGYSNSPNDTRIRSNTDQISSNREVCYIAKDDGDFVKLIKVALEENSAEKILERQNVARENSWDRKVEKMLEIINTRMVSNSARIRSNGGYSNDSNNARIDSNDIVLPNLSYKIMGILFKVHNELGPSLLEKYYQRAIAEELTRQGLSFKCEAPVMLLYRGAGIGKYVLDFIIEDQVILEIKAQARTKPKFYKQAVAYLKQTNLPLVILVNFRSDRLRYKRIVNPEFRGVDLSPIDSRFE